MNDFKSRESASYAIKNEEMLVSVDGVARSVIGTAVALGQNPIDFAKKVLITGNRAFMLEVIEQITKLSTTKE